MDLTLTLWVLQLEHLPISKIDKLKLIFVFMNLKNLLVCSVGSTSVYRFCHPFTSHLPLLRYSLLAL